MCLTGRKQRTAEIAGSQRGIIYLHADILVVQQSLPLFNDQAVPLVFYTSRDTGVMEQRFCFSHCALLLTF